MNVNKIHIITDTHIGVRSNSLEWLKIMEDFFYDWYIPYLRKNVEPNDILVHCGDLCDSRQSINLLVLNKVIDIFQEISTILPVYIILGNHDIYHKSTNDIHSLRILNHINNITVIQEPEIITLDNGKTLFMLPWRANHEVERDTVLNNTSDYLFCHLDINGFKFNSLSNAINDTNDISLFDRYLKVFNGHIHYRQSKKNVNLLGCPYQLTRGDSGNSKGVYLFDPNSNDLKFIENTYSPRFLKFKLSLLLEKTLGEFQGLTKNNFVDIIVTTEQSTSIPLNQLIELSKEHRQLNIILDNTDTDIDVTNITSESELINFDIIDFSNRYVDNLDFSDKMKNLLKQKVQYLYNKVVNVEEEE